MVSRAKPCRKVRMRGLLGMLGYPSPSKVVRCAYGCADWCPWYLRRRELWREAHQ